MAVITAVRAADMRYLDRAHASLLGQSAVDWEWHVEIDGLDVSEPWSVLDDRVHVRCSGRQLGVAAARNLALVGVRAPVLTVLDADDGLPPGALARHLAELRSQRVFAVSGAARVVDDLTGDQSIREPSAPEGTYDAGQLPELALEHARLPTPTQCASFRTDALRAVGGWPGMVLCQDVAAFMLVAQRWPVRVLHDVLYEYHRRPGQSTETQELERHDLMHRSRLLLAQQLQAQRALSASDAVVEPVSEPTY